MVLQINTKKEQEMIEITADVRKVVAEAGVEEGVAVVYVPHTTAGVTINENGDPDVVRDILTSLNKNFPVVDNYRHFEGNSHAHIKASLMGSSCLVPIEGGRMQLGRWQGIYFCEFDGPRRRSVLVNVYRAK